MHTFSNEYNGKYFKRNKKRIKRFVFAKNKINIQAQSAQ